MNEALIKEIVKCKLHIANELIEHLPEEVSEEIKKAGKVILDSLNESAKEVAEQSVKKTKTSDQLNNVQIE